MPVHKNKRMIVICCSLAVILVGIGITLAYLGAADKRENKVIVGRGDVSITESTWTEPTTQLMENSTSKDVKVTNTGTVPCYVRVYMEFSDSEVGDVAKVTGGNSIDADWSNFKTALAAGTNLISPKWRYVYNDPNDKLNGYFYYTEPVAPNGITTALITAVKTDFNGNNNNDSNIDKIKPYEIIVYSETVQTIGTDGTDYGTTKDWKNAWQVFLK